MPSFDALRPAVCGPLSYICRPKEKPADLLCCFPLNDSALDVSRYGVLLPSLPTFYNEGPLGKCAALSGVVSHPTTNVFSIEFFAKFPNSNSVYIYISSGSYTSGGSTYGRLNYNSGYGTVILSAFGTNTVTLNTPSPLDWNHIAITYDGTTAKAYCNGSLSSSKTCTMNPQYSLTFNSTIKVCNLRVVSKVLGDSSYPVPTGYFTGYEPL